MRIPRVGSWSLAARLTLWYSGTVLLLLGVSALVQYRTLARDLASEDDQQLLETIAAANRGTLPISEAGPSTSLLGPRVRLVDGLCNVVLGEPKIGGPPPLCGLPDGDGIRYRSWTSPDGRVWRTASQKVSAAVSAAISGGFTGSGDPVRVEATLDRWTDTELLAAYRRKLLILLPAAVLASTLVGSWIVRRGLSSLRALATVVSNVDAESLHQVFKLREPERETPAEVRELMTSLDRMRVRLSEQFALLTKFSSELAHEFRTPIHVLRQQAEVALRKGRTPEEYREVLSSSLEEYDRLHHMVDDILFLARAEDPFSRISRSTLSIADEVADVAGFLEALAEDQGVTLRVDGQERATISADRTLLRRALVNVLSNAIRNTPSGGLVTVSAAQDNLAVTIQVTDTGSGISREALPHVFERYYRAPNLATHSEGTGLGLAIVRGIMTLHGGSATIASEQGRGTTISLAFPNGVAPGVLDPTPRILTKV